MTEALSHISNEILVVPFKRKVWYDDYKLVVMLEGSIVMSGGKEVTPTPGRTFYEGPSDVHVVGRRNASPTIPAKFVVFFVKDKGAGELN